MSWIDTIAYEKADAKLKALYDRVKGPNNNVDNIMMMHSLRPHTMEGHMAIYKYVLHHRDNTIDKWFLETLGVWVSTLNKCEYCIEHHFAGLKRLLNDDEKATQIRSAIFTHNPGSIREESIEKLRADGYTDGEILEINQVCAYFSYANRTVLGLGCSTKGDILGLSPNNNDDPNDWGHS